VIRRLRAFSLQDRLVASLVLTLPRRAHYFRRETTRFSSLLLPHRMAARADTLKLLQARRDGDAEAGALLFEHLYGELRTIAHQRLRQFRPGQTLDTTALVHEAYLRLVDQRSAGGEDRSHFLAVASRAMRFIVVDYARERTAAKRGGAQSAVDVDRVQVAARDRAHDVLDLDDALRHLSEFDPRLAEVVEYRFFGGLTHDEIADITGRSIATVKRDWTRARGWLFHTMSGG
jgi:RNA polymerase sigma factor (TIGR02999 family)